MPVAECGALRDRGGSTLDIVLADRRQKIVCQGNDACGRLRRPAPPPRPRLEELQQDHEARASQKGYSHGSRGDGRNDEHEPMQPVCKAAPVRKQDARGHQEETSEQKQAEKQDQIVKAPVGAEAHLRLSADIPVRFRDRFDRTPPATGTPA